MRTSRPLWPYIGGLTESRSPRASRGRLPIVPSASPSSIYAPRPLVALAFTSACGTDHKIHTGASGLETSGSRYSLRRPWAAVAPHSPFPISATSPSEPPCSRTWFRTTHYN